MEYTEPSVAVHPSGDKSYGRYALAVGNGIDASNSSNAFTIDWAGNTVASGTATTADMTAQEVEDFVDSLNVSGGGSVHQSFTPTAGTSYANYGGCYYEVFGKIVHLHFGISNLTANTATTIYTIPEGLRPPSKIFAQGTSGTINSQVIVEANTDGTVTAMPSSTYCGCDVYYILGA